MKRIISNIIAVAAKFHPKNHTAERIVYPQLWDCWPRWSKRIRWIHRLKTGLCGSLTGHEWSETEIGYGGCGVDRWCRWCDKMVTMPRQESPLPDKLAGLAGLVDSAPPAVHEFVLRAAHLPRPRLCVSVCNGPNAYRAEVRRLAGHMSPGARSTGWAVGDTMYLVIQRGCRLPAVAQAAAKAATLWGVVHGLDATDNQPRRPTEDATDIWTPGEIVVCLAEQVIERVMPLVE